MALRLSEGLGVNVQRSRIDEFVVLAMRTDPEPVNALRARQAESPVVQPNSDAVHLPTTEQLELKGRVG